MPTYRKVWIKVTGVLVVAGLATLVLLTVVAAPWFAAVALICCALARFALRRREADGSPVPSLTTAWHRAGLDARAGMLLPVAVLACVGLETALGPSGAVLLLLDLLAGLPLLADRRPPVLPKQRTVVPDAWTFDVRLGALVPAASDHGDGPGGRRPRPLDLDPAFERSLDELFDPGSATRPVVDADDRVERRTPIALSNAELSHAWRASYRALRLAVDPRDQARIAAARARYLDAVQERDPHGFARWVLSEDAVCRDPSPFLGPDRPGSTDR